MRCDVLERRLFDFFADVLASATLLQWAQVNKREKDGPARRSRPYTRCRSQPVLSGNHFPALGVICGRAGTSPPAGAAIGVNKNCPAPMVAAAGAQGSRRRAGAEAALFMDFLL